MYVCLTIDAGQQQQHQHQHQHHGRDPRGRSIDRSLHSSAGPQTPHDREITPLPGRARRSRRDQTFLPPPRAPSPLSGSGIGSSLPPLLVAWHLAASALAQQTAPSPTRHQRPCATQKPSFCIAAPDARPYLSHRNLPRQLVHHAVQRVPGLHPRPDRREAVPPQPLVQLGRRRPAAAAAQGRPGLDVAEL